MEPKQQLHLDLGHHAEDKMHDVFEPAWRKLRDYCRRELHHGELVIQIQDALPVMAKLVKKNVRL